MPTGITRWHCMYWNPFAWFKNECDVCTNSITLWGENSRSTCQLLRCSWFQTLKSGTITISVAFPTTVILGVQTSWHATWRFRLDLELKLLGQKVQWKGRSPVWLRICRSRLHFWLKRLEHRWHWCGFSPVCRCMWRARFIFWLKPLPHKVHRNERSGFQRTTMPEWRQVSCLSILSLCSSEWRASWRTRWCLVGHG